MKSKALINRTFIQTSTALLVLLLTATVVFNGKIFLTIFGGVLIAVLFYKPASWLSQKTPVSVNCWLPITIMVPFLIVALFFVYTAPRLAAQAGELADRLPQTGDYLQARFEQLPWSGELAEKFDDFSRFAPESSTVLRTLSGFFSSTLDGLGSFTFACFLGIFLAINPKIYLNGLLKLFPLAKRQRAGEVLNATGSVLSGWLIAKIASMIVVGVFTTAGLWALDIDLALILGILAALLSFIPNIGPIMAFIPAAMISAANGFDALLYVTALYVGIQTIESYVLTPILQKEIIDMPPALTLVTQVILATMTGMTGVLLAAPLTAALMVVVKMAYTEDFLGDKSAEQSS